MVSTTPLSTSPTSYGSGSLSRYASSSSTPISSPKTPQRGLAVDDDKLSCMVAQNALKKMGCPHVDTAHTLQAAIHMLEQDEYDVVISDHNINTGEADNDDERQYTKQLGQQLFPNGLPKGAAEGVLLLEFIKQHLAKQAEQKSQKIPHTILISAVEGVEEGQLAQYAHERDADFIKKPINKAKIQQALENPFVTHNVANPPEKALNTTNPVIPIPQQDPESIHLLQAEETSTPADRSCCTKLSDCFKGLWATLFPPVANQHEHIV